MKSLEVSLAVAAVDKRKKSREIRVALAAPGGEQNKSLEVRLAVAAAGERNKHLKFAWLRRPPGVENKRMHLKLAWLKRVPGGEKTTIT